MAKLFAGIHRVKLRGAYSYLLEDGDLLMIDAGHRGSGLPLRRYFQRSGISLSRLGGVIVTHAHPDHCGGINDVLSLVEVPIHVHELEAPHLAGEVGWPNPFVHPVLAGTMSPIVRRLNPSPVRAPVPFADGFRFNVLGGLRVIHTPGHTPGSSCLFLENRGILFGGDALEFRGGRLGEPNTHFTVDRSQAARSIRKLAGLPIETILLAHFPPVHHAQRRLRHLADELGV